MNHNRPLWLLLTMSGPQACFYNPTSSSHFSANSSSTDDASTSGWSSICGDGICSLEEFRAGDPTCAKDCDSCLPLALSKCYFDGDGTCELSKGESAENSTDCTQAVCSDGWVDPGEACDDGNLVSSDNCTSKCLNAACGDGFLHFGHEECDDENVNSSDSCLNDCRKSRCGDGFVWVGHEACDDGNLDNTDHCTSDCEWAKCGDGYIEIDIEDCDDANTIQTDDCLNSCILPNCGDGFLHPSEDCDDGNENETDYCSSTCQHIPHRRVFVTSKVFDSDLNGLSGADAKCVDLAASAGLKNAAAFKAWLSNSVEGPADRFDKDFTGIYNLLDGKIIAEHGWSDLTDGMLAHAIDQDETQVTLPNARVWSNTAVDGTSLPAQSNCNDWEGQNLEEGGGVGFTFETGSSWTNGSIFFCPLDARLYCFEDPL